MLSLLLPVDRIPSQSENGEAQTACVKTSIRLTVSGRSFFMQLKNSEDALMGFPSHDCIRLGRRLDEHNEVR